MIDEDKNKYLALLPSLESAEEITREIKIDNEEEAFPMYGQLSKMQEYDLRDIRAIHANLKKITFTIKRLTKNK